jgi:hypothetical protein
MSTSAVQIRALGCSPRTETKAPIASLSPRRVKRERAGTSAGLFRFPAIFLLNSTPEPRASGVPFALKPRRYLLGESNGGCCRRHSVVHAQSPFCARTEMSDARSCCRNGSYRGEQLPWFGQPPKSNRRCKSSEAARITFST